MRFIDSIHEFSVPQDVATTLRSQAGRFMARMRVELRDVGGYIVAIPSAGLVLWERSDGIRRNVDVSVAFREGGSIADAHCFRIDRSLLDEAEIRNQCAGAAHVLFLYLVGQVQSTV